MRLHLREWGSGERNALLLHGLSSDGSAWWRVGPALAERGYHVSAVDLRGHGRSPRGELRAGGFDVQVIPGAGHSIFRDDFAGFMNCLNGWLE